MSFSDTEKSISDSEPIELYKFIGTNQTWLVTSYSRPVTIGIETYTPLEGLKRSTLKNGTQEEEGTAIDITIPYDHPIASIYAFNTAPPKLSVIVYRTHRSAISDAALSWTGKVLSFSVEGRECKLRVPSLFSYLLAGTVPGPRYQAPCNHQLYDSRCQVDPSLHSETTTIADINENQITLSSTLLTDNVCVAGDMTWSAGSEARMIIEHSGTSFTVSYPFSNLQVGDTVTIRKGCDHSFETCKSKFDNGINFGGCPLVPGKNPFIGTP